ncbi:hypothetical protein FQA47_011907 [Oryzias melastigma]|uniref:Uncharacterized protein n=1 Tax=Oryzias melastigma TaxID=30732 RepID=A0A834CD88_ORYME|nr:hypothetical protein FQA47_011907 [Oryzias melastigma]
MKLFFYRAAAACRLYCIYRLSFACCTRTHESFSIVRREKKPSPALRNNPNKLGFYGRSATVPPNADNSKVKSGRMCVTPNVRRADTSCMAVPQREKHDFTVLLYKVL